MRRARAALTAVAVAATAAVLAGAALPGEGADPPAADEYRVKAAIVYNLAKFVEWPADAFAAASTPLNICVLGVDPFGQALDDAFRGHLVAGRTVTLRRTAEVEPGCHLVFISGSERKRMAVLADRLRTSSVLTVSEQEGFCAIGGMIELFTEGDHVRFNLTVAAIEAARLRVSARLREIASNEKHLSGDRR